MADRTPLRRGIAVAAAIGAAMTLLGGCHIPSEGNKSDFLVKNTTSMTLKVVMQGQNPNATRPPGTGGLTPVTLKPGDSVGLFIGLSRGNCKHFGLAAYDQADHLVATLPSPICEDEKGHGNTWTIKQPRRT